MQQQTTIPRPRPAAELREHVRAGAENRPGIYRMIGPADNVLYVGKSIRVRTRLLSYFRAKRGEKAAEIIGHTHRIEWEYAPSEFACLLQEMRSIQRSRPPYNVEHKRDRVFCFIKVTAEAAPRLVQTFEIGDDGATYYGPFRGRLRVRELIRLIVDLLELRDCAASTRLRFADQLDLFGREDAPLCLRADVGRCLAPCCGRCTRGEYMARVAIARRFLDGDVDTPIGILRGRMQTAAELMQFEYAAAMRDRAEQLRVARDELLALRGTIEGLTFIYEVPGYDGDGRVYIIRRGRIRAELPPPASPAERATIVQRARAIFRGRDITEAEGTEQVAEVLLLARWFRLRPAELENIWELDDATSHGLRVLGAYA